MGFFSGQKVNQCFVKIIVVVLNNQFRAGYIIGNRHGHCVSRTGFVTWVNMYRKSYERECIT